MWRHDILNQTDIVETIPKIYRLNTTPTERNIFALELHFGDRTALSVCLSLSLFLSIYIYRFLELNI